MKILGLDPGTHVTGWCEYDADAREVMASGVMPNAAMLDHMGYTSCETLAIERMSGSGAPVGRETHETNEWVGRFYQRWISMPSNPALPIFVYRHQVKSYLCPKRRVGDKEIRQRLIELFGEPGTRKNPGPTYGVTSHGWAALAVAATVANVQDMRIAA